MAGVLLTTLHQTSLGNRPSFPQVSLELFGGDQGYAEVAPSLCEEIN